jgi:hypothetical protein
MILIGLQIIFINFSILNIIFGQIPIIPVRIHIICVPECSRSTLETKEWKVEYSTSIQKSSPVARVFNICEQQNKID